MAIAFPMRKCALLILIGLCVPAGAQEGATPAGAGELAAPLRKFDRDGDGRLSGEELKLARQAHNRGGRDAEPGPGRWREILARQEREFVRRRERDFDANGDGKVDDHERGAMRAVWKRIADQYAELRATITAKYDRNDDGELNDRERNASRQESDRLRREIEDRCLDEWRAKAVPKPGTGTVNRGASAVF
jgi:EF hand